MKIDLDSDQHPRSQVPMSSSSPKYTNWSGKPPPPRGSIACVSPMMREQVLVSETGPEHHIYMETPRTPNTQTLIKTHNESHHHLLSMNTPAHRTGQGNCSFNEPPTTSTCHQQYYSQSAIPAQITYHHPSHPRLDHDEPENSVQIKEQFVLGEETNSHEFLPICDLMFGAVSLIAYFADIVFDLIIIDKESDTNWFLPMIFLVIFSSIFSQYFSFRWYIDYENPISPSTSLHPGKASGKSNWSSPELIGVVITHFFQSGILWRYFRLFVPVNLMTVKHEVGNLCMLRMIHAFLQSAPMALIQIYLIWQRNDFSEVSDAEVISASLSLFNLCWALASFSKNCQQKHVHKLVLTWLGVIFQFFWRFGMVSSRIVALTVYAAVYKEFVFLVIGLHWFSASLWLLSPRNVFEKETDHKSSSSIAHRFLPSLFIGWIFNFCYVNLHEENARHKMIAFYCTMFVENTLLTSVSLMGHRAESFVYTSFCSWIVWGGFAFGLFAMVLYYQYFHIRYIKLSLLASNFDFLSNSNGHNKRQLPNSLPRNQTVHLNQAFTNSRQNGSGLVSPGSSGMMTGIPGVFNCRLNPALKRKKKKPSSFVPRPPEPPNVPGGNRGVTIHENQFVSSSLNPVPTSHC